MLNDKGVAPLIAFILLFGIIVGYIALLQSSFVPEWNREVEIKHSQRIVDELRTLEVMLSNCESGKVVVDTGVVYPQRPLLVNPPSAFTTVEAYELNVTINGKSYPSMGIAFKTGYHYLSSTIFYLEHAALLKLQNSHVVDYGGISWTKDKIEILLLNTTFKSFSSNKPVTLVIDPISYGGEKFYRTLNLTFESANEETASWWEEKLKSEGLNVTREGRILKVNETNVTVSLLYVGLSTRTPSFQPLFPCSIVNVTERDLEVTQGDTLTLTSRVVDRLGNPVRKYPVEITFQPATAENPNREVYTDKNGVVWTYFNAVASGLNIVRFSGCGNSTEFTINVNPATGQTCNFELQWLDGSSYTWNTKKNESRIFEVELKYNGNAVENALLTLSVDNQSVVKVSGSNPETDQNGRAWINLTATDSGNAKLLAYYGGCSAILNLVVNISTKYPVAAFTYSPSYPSVGETITFDASSSYDPDGSIVSYEWDLDGDGSYGDAVGQTVTYTFSTWGSHTVGLRVTDNDGLTNTTRVIVYVGDLVYNNDAIADDGPDSPVFYDADGGVIFSVTNRYPTEVVIDKITIDTSFSFIDYLDDSLDYGANNKPKYAEIYVDATIPSYVDYYGGVSIPATVDLGVDGNENSGTNAVVGRNSTATFYLYEFYYFGGLFNANMHGEVLSVTVQYVVGTETKTKTFTFTVS
ncbi:PKD domain-containing protein [Archaeoglobus neptunius]|uniref:PKD domain-containing protein n=1 Tax=Archaeoglobus neptunius TaxID=2798580 RepID=UPI0019254517|nr:PKD domain-containing protein [Archaeoglobus neptunius]